MNQAQQLEDDLTQYFGSFTEKIFRQCNDQDYCESHNNYDSVRIIANDKWEGCFSLTERSENLREFLKQTALYNYPKNHFLALTAIDALNKLGHRADNLKAILKSGIPDNEYMELDHLDDEDEDQQRGGVKYDDGPRWDDESDYTPNKY